MRQRAACATPKRKQVMKRPYWLLAVTLTVNAADFALEGKLWWAHIQFLADDKLQGRDTGSEGLRQAETYVSKQFDRIGLKPAGTSAYLQPVKLERRRVVPDESSLALIRDGV